MRRKWISASAIAAFVANLGFAVEVRAGGIFVAQSRVQKIEQERRERYERQRRTEEDRRQRRREPTTAVQPTANPRDQIREADRATPPPQRPEPADKLRVEADVKAQQAAADARAEKERHDRLEGERGERQKDPVLVDVAAAKAAKVDHKLFGIALGEPLEMLGCSTESGLFGEMVKVESIRGSCQKPNQLDSDISIYFERGKLPKWARGPVWAKMGGGVVLAASILVEEDNDFVQQMTGKYKKKPIAREVSFSNAFGKSWTAHEFEWRLPGIHVAFELKETQLIDMGREGILSVEGASLSREKESKESADKAERLAP